MAAKRPWKKEWKRGRGLSMSNELYRALALAAGREMRTRSGWVVKVVVDYLRQHHPDLAAECEPKVKG